jgi:HTH-type transcriptional regulator/antitoxin HigA
MKELRVKKTVGHPGLELKQKIEAAGFSQKELARQLNMQESQFSEVLNGKRPFTPTFCLALQRLFGLNAKEWNRKQADYDLEQARAGE